MESWSTSQACASFCIQVPMLEVQAPNHSRRKSRYRKALKTRVSNYYCTRDSAARSDRVRAADEVHDVAVGVVEEHQPVSLHLLGRLEEFHVLGREPLAGRVEILDVDGQMAEPGSLGGLRRARPFRGNDLDHRAIRSLDKHVARIPVIDAEPEMLDVPLRQPLGIGGRNRGVFDSGEHGEILAEKPGAGS